jgi:hypothetical protein
MKIFHVTIVIYICIMPEFLYNPKYKNNIDHILSNYLTISYATPLPMFTFVITIVTN